MLECREPFEAMFQPQSRSFFFSLTHSLALSSVTSRAKENSSSVFAVRCSDAHARPFRRISPPRSQRYQVPSVPTPPVDNLTEDFLALVRDVGKLRCLMRKFPAAKIRICG